MKEGYCTLLAISDNYGCLVFARNNHLYVNDNQTLHFMLHEIPQEERLKRLELEAEEKAELEN